jgi:hypothetical protein
LISGARPKFGGSSARWMDPRLRGDDGGGRQWPHQRNHPVRLVHHRFPPTVLPTPTVTPAFPPSLPHTPSLPRRREPIQASKRPRSPPQVRWLTSTLDGSPPARGCRRREGSLHPRKSITSNNPPFPLSHRLSPTLRHSREGGSPSKVQIDRGARPKFGGSPARWMDPRLRGDDGGGRATQRSDRPARSCVRRGSAARKKARAPGPRRYGGCGVLKQCGAQLWQSWRARGRMFTIFDCGQ